MIESTQRGNPPRDRASDVRDVFSMAYLPTGED